MNDQDRDKVFEQMLRRTLRQPSSAPASPCPEPDLLAAYFDHALSVEETASLEIHFSACERCRQSLATLAVAEEQPLDLIAAPSVAMPPAGAPEFIPKAGDSAAPGRRALPSHQFPFLSWRWLAPAMAAAAALVLWVSLRPAPTTERASLSPGQITPPSVAQDADSPPTPQANQDAGKSNAETELNKEPEPKLALNSSNRVHSDSARPEPQPVPRRSPRGRLKNLEVNKPDSQPVAPPQERRELTAKVAPESLPVQGDQLGLKQESRLQTPAGTRQALTTQHALSATIDEKQVVHSETKGQTRSDQTTPPAQKLSDRSEKKDDKKKSVAVPVVPSKVTPTADAFYTTEVVEVSPRDMDRGFLRQNQVPAPGTTTRWRFGLRGSIERSRDGGHSWQPQKSPTSADLLAGVAPTESVCWIVGRNGTILRTTDGERWEKISSPAKKDWLAVESSSALAATITSQDSLRYFTIDGGRTWRRQ